jgi:hypothetical protein
MLASVKILNYRIYLREFLIIFFCYLLTEQCFAWLFVPDAQITAVFVKLVSIAVYAFILADFKNLQLAERIITGIVTVLLLQLMMQSLILYGVPFKHFEIYTVLSAIPFVIFTKSMMRKLNADLLGFVAGFYLVVYLVFMALHGKQFSFSLEHIEPNSGPFSGDTRIIHAHSIFMMIIPFLWYLNDFIMRPKGKTFLLFILCFTIIVVHQHRSVWSSAIFATVIYFALIFRTNRQALRGIPALLTLTILLGMSALYYISSIWPDMLSFFGQRFTEILNPEASHGTGGFRMEQREAYLTFIKQKPLFGWSFEGYDLKNPLVDWWDDNTGHHFHEGFVEILFYHGVFGFLLKFSFLIFISVKALSRNLSNRAVVLIPFCICGLMFSLNYVLPFVFWGHAGMCLYYLEKEKNAAFLKSNN